MLMKYPNKLMYLNIWFPVGGALEGGAQLEEVDCWRMSFEVYSLAMLVPMCLLVQPDASKVPPAWLQTVSVPMPFPHSGWYLLKSPPRINLFSTQLVPVRNFIRTM